MDWDKNGMVNFKEFLFAFTRWVGIDNDDEEDDDACWKTEFKHRYIQRTGICSSKSFYWSNNKWDSYILPVIHYNGVLLFELCAPTPE